jgi:hypothetical protein
MRLPLLLLGLLSLGAACPARETGGKKMEATTTSHPWKDLWRGAGPPGSPTGAPPGLTIAYTREAWTRVITAFGPPLDAHAALPVSWGDQVILFVQGNEASPSTEAHIVSVSRAGGVVAVAATLRAGPADQPSLGAEVRPSVIASLPATVLAGAEVRFTLDGRALPVTHER